MRWDFPALSSSLRMISSTRLSFRLLCALSRELTQEVYLSYAAQLSHLRGL